jgi:cell wall-associated NlpC family hydrolase
VPTPSVASPTLSGLRVRPQPVGAALSVLGAAAAVTAVVVPLPTALETTGSLAPVESAAPAPAVPLGQVPAAPAALPDQPTVQIKDLVSDVTAQMRNAQTQKAEPAAATPFATVANTTALSSSPAAMRKAAMTNALAKLGKPYRYGAVGPNSFDCSGLVKYSFAKTGRALPRTSRAMASVGTPVKKADLQPGDLVFFYQPISHVGIYIGNGKIVHASRTGQPVKISDMARMRFTTARRV